MFQLKLGDDVFKTVTSIEERLEIRPLVNIEALEIQDDDTLFKPTK